MLCVQSARPFLPTAFIPKLRGSPQLFDAFFLSRIYILETKIRALQPLVMLARVQHSLFRARVCVCVYTYVRSFAGTCTSTQKKPYQRRLLFYSPIHRRRAKAGCPIDIPRHTLCRATRFIANVISVSRSIENETNERGGGVGSSVQWQTFRRTYEWPPTCAGFLFSACALYIRDCFARLCCARDSLVWSFFFKVPVHFSERFELPTPSGFI